MSPYDVLQVSTRATEEEIRMAYKAMAKQWHPDRKLDDQETATRKFKEINSAYRAILHERRRDTKRQSSSAKSSSKHSSSRETPSSTSHSKSLRDNDHQSSGSKIIRSSDNKDNTTLTHSNNKSENVEEPHKRHRNSARKEEQDSLAKMTATPSSVSSCTSSPSSSSSIPLPSLSSFSSRSSSSGSSSRSSSRSRTSSRKSDDDDFDKLSSTSSRTSVVAGSTDDLPDYDAEEKNGQPLRVSGGTKPVYSAWVSSEVATDDEDVSEITLPDVLDVEHGDADVIPPSTSSSDKRSSTVPSEHEERQKPPRSSHSRDSSRKVKDDGEHSDRTLIPEFDCPLARSVGVTDKWTYTIQLTLMQLFRGKKMRFKIVRCKLDGKRKSVTMDVNIAPGTLHGTQIIFKGAGHELKDGTRQDIIFIVEETKHERFVRMKEDLALDVRLPWLESLKDEVGTVHVKGLDGRESKFEVDFKTEGNVTGTAVIPGAGMPIPKTKTRGNLLVRWEIFMQPAPSRWETFKQSLHL